MNVIITSIGRFTVLEPFLIVVIIILTAVIVIMAVKIFNMQRSMDSITEELKQKISIDTNSLITLNTGDKHIRKLASELNKELQRLRKEEIKYIRGNDELQKAIVNISHDLRTPLTAISGYLDLLEQEEKSNEAEQYLEVIRDRIEVLKSLTEELFRYSVVTSTTDGICLEDVVINSEIESAIAGMYGAFVERGITPEIVIPEEKVIRKLDRRSFQRICANILSNALKYSDGDLTVELKTNGEILFANKTDRLDATDVGKLFDRFFTVENAHYSTGLGLSIAKLLAERNSGTIGAELKDGRLIIRVCF